MTTLSAEMRYAQLFEERMAKMKQIAGERVANEILQKSKELSAVTPHSLFSWMDDLFYKWRKENL